MLMRNFIAFLLILSFNQALKSQFTNNEQIREKFNYEIIQLDEFIQRFNFDNNTKLLKYLTNNYPDLSIDRKGFLITLFDNNKIHYQDSLINTFIDFVSDTTNPKYLNFYDHDWYAEVNCIIEYQHSIDTGKIILKNQFNNDFSSKWVITGISTEILELPKSKDSLKIISPVSHGTGFIALYDVFKDGANIQNYITKDYSPDTLTYFISLMYFNKIKLREVNEVKYHFLQIPGWTFTVEYFNRKELNSGWLISGLMKMSNNEKGKYKKEILKINNTDKTRNSKQLDK